MAKKKEPAIAVDNQQVVAAVNEATAPVNAVIEQEFEAEVDISSLQPHASNPNEGDEKAILGSITDIGFYGAVIAQKSTRTILVGEHRWKAAKAKKAKTIPVVWVNCNDLEAVRILLADNRTADLARYKEAEKRALLKSCVDRYGGQFLNGTGFTRLDIKMPKSALDSITRPAVKEAVKGNNAHHKPKTTVTNDSESPPRWEPSKSLPFVSAGFPRPDARRSTWCSTEPPTTCAIAIALRTCG